ncbi:MAG: DUF4402 domain-containing protein [Bdellovibrionales bacterium]
MKINKYMAALVLGGTMFSGAVLAANNSVTTPVTATLTFDTPLSVTKDSDINFGSLQAGMANAYTISPAGALTATTPAGILFGTPVAGQLTIAGSTTQTISIQVQNYQANGGVTLSDAMCNYNGGGATACDTAMPSQLAPGSGKILLLGVTATTTSATPAGVATPSFDVVVTYS